MLHGDLGRSINTQRAGAAASSSTLFPATVELSLVAMLIAVVIGLPAGILAAVRAGHDRSTTS